MPNQSGRIVLILILSLLLMGVVYSYSFVFNKQEYKNTLMSPSVAPSDASYSKFISEKMKFSIGRQPEYLIEEDSTYVNVVDDNGKINISRVDSNSLDLKDYLDYFDNKRGLTIERQEDIKVNALNGVKRIEKFLVGPIQEQKIVYLITQDGWVYSLSTSNESLYPALDQIVQSFEYKP